MASTYLQTLGQVKQDFWSSNAHLSEEQRQELWLHAASIPPSNRYNSAQPSMIQQTPRSMTSRTSDLTHLPTSGFESMAGTRLTSATDRSISTNAVDITILQRSNSSLSDWQPMPQESTNNYTFYSGPSMRQQSTFPPVVEATSFINDSTVEYSVDDYVNCIEHTSSSSPPLSIPQHSQQLHVQLTPMQWSSSSDGSTSPSTPSTALMTPGTQSSHVMSRQGSYNPHSLESFAMLRMQSDSSCMLPILSEDGAFPFVSNVESKTISDHVDSSHFLDFAGPASEGFFSSLSHSVPASTQVLASSDIEQSYLGEDMRRSASTSSRESNASDASAPSSTYSRQSRREREINAQAASRKIAPKAVESNDETDSASSNAQMARIRSDDGSSKTVGVISKTPYVRPQHPKIMCQYCNERPDGFRGTHELDRHIARAHASSRKGYQCVDYSEDKKFLASCKHCRNKKVYGAYYNAAAHLRRTHFHPRKRGRKGKNDEKRGGIGGGDHPPMEYLKQHWIIEVEVDNKPQPQSPESSDDVPEPVNNSYDATYSLDATASYPSSQQQTATSMNTQIPIDPGQYLEQPMSMYASEPMMMYDSTAFTAFNPDIPATNQISNFEFDAYSSMP